MVSGQDPTYRLKVAVGFLKEMHQDIVLGRGHSAEDRSVLFYTFR